ncbi:MAG: response regulator [Thermoplasmata archaeon]|nr:response regulator [Thermoplasmata archaeon]
MDDDADFRTELRELLETDGHIAAMASSVPKAIEHLEHDEVDVLITDLKMPRHSGLELLKEVRKRWPRTYVVLLTGYASVDTAIDAMKEGAFDYLRKPVRMDRVREVLRLVVQEREFEGQPGSARDPRAEAAELASSGEYQVLFLGPNPPVDGPHLKSAPFDPRRLDALRAFADSFLSEFPHPALVFAGVEELMACHRLEEVVEIIEGRGPLRVAFDPHRMPTAAAVALGSVVAVEEIHRTFEALASPIRRKVLARLEQGPVGFSDLLRVTGIRDEDSSKLAFHLHKLTETQLVGHEGDQYRLTSRGSASARLLADAVFLPSQGPGASRAFPAAPSR